MKNTLPTSSQKVSSQKLSLSSQLSESVKALLLGALVFSSTPSQAQETGTQSPDSSQLIAEADLRTNKSDATFEDKQLNEKMNFAIADVSRLRNWIVMYDEAVKNFSSLSKDDQYNIALAIDPENGQWWQEWAIDFVELTQDLRLPLIWIDWIVNELIEKGIDGYEVEDIRGALIEFREWSLSNADIVYYFSLLAEYNKWEIASSSFGKIYLILTPETREEYEAVTAEQEAVTAEQEAIDEYGNTLQERLELQRRATKALQDAANAVSE